jgi:hypothetical protein
MNTRPESNVAKQIKVKSRSHYLGTAEKVHKESDTYQYQTLARHRAGCGLDAEFASAVRE